METKVTQAVKRIDEIEKAMAGKELGDEIERLRLREGWSQEELGERIGLSQSRVSKMEIGEHNFPLETVYRLALAFEKSPFELAAIYWGIEVEQLSNKDKELLNNLLKLFDDYRKDVPSDSLLPPHLKQLTNKTPHPINKVDTGLVQKEIKRRGKAKQSEKKPPPDSEETDKSL